MGRKAKAVVESSLFRTNNAETTAQELEWCRCLPFSPLHYGAQQEGVVDHEQMVPVPLALNNRVRTVLELLFPGVIPLSILILHISQQEYVHGMEQPERRRYHAPAGLLEQVMVNVSRVIRVGDQQIVHENAGAAIIFPNVDQQGVCSIVERVYHSIDLLQAETVIPPLKRETAIMLGVGSSPAAGTSLEDLLYQAGYVARSLVLRPAIAIFPYEFAGQPQQRLQAGTSSVFPFMELPQELSQDLKHLIPYHLARELKCAPVGQDHHSLTVAMLDPGDMNSVRRLQGETGLNIFPVACSSEELQSLLAHQW